MQHPNILKKALIRLYSFNVNLGIYGNCPKILYTKVSDNMAYETVQTQIKVKEQSDQGLHCLPFH